jgi:hypothetical protein
VGAYQDSSGNPHVLHTACCFGSLHMHLTLLPAAAATATAAAAAVAAARCGCVPGLPRQPPCAQGGGQVHRGQGRRGACRLQRELLLLSVLLFASVTLNILLSGAGTAWAQQTPV